MPTERRQRTRVTQQRAIPLAGVVLSGMLVAASWSQAAAQPTQETAHELNRQAADLWVARDFAEADRLYGEAIEAYAAVGDRHMTAFMHSNRASVRLNLERWDDAIADARHADGLFAQAIAELDPRAAGASDTNSPLNLARRGRVMALASLRAAAMARNRLAEAERFQREQLALFEAIGDENPAGLASSHDGLAEIASLAGRHDEAAAHYDQAAALWQRSNELYGGSDYKERYGSDYAEQQLRASVANAQAARQRTTAGANAAPVRTFAPDEGRTVAEVAETSTTTAETQANSRTGAAEVAEGAESYAAGSELGQAFPDQPETARTSGANSTTVEDIALLIGAVIGTLGSFLVPLLFGAGVLFVIVKGAKQKQRAQAAVIQHKATAALRKARPAVQGSPPRELAARRQPPSLSAPSPPSVDLPPPVVGGPSQTVVEHKGTGWCGCIALVILIAGLSFLVPWLLRTLDVF
jgi:tetratricopeptide (TPR) repeat protein